ncbi:MAG: hypothetical protein O2960_28860, partial [Verrucomicrobia bacterium]|nr:hypothetical protein [Verrucomicrobiota bacterium]
HPRKPLLQIATVQEPLHGPGDDWSSKAIALPVALFINPLELGIESRNQLIKRRLLRLPGTIETDPLLCFTHHNPPP